jgi:hypothetical protein
MSLKQTNIKHFSMHTSQSIYGPKCLVINSIWIIGIRSQVSCICHVIQLDDPVINGDFLLVYSCTVHFIISIGYHLAHSWNLPWNKIPKPSHRPLVWTCFKVVTNLLFVKTKFQYCAKQSGCHWHSLPSKFNIAERSEPTRVEPLIYLKILITAVTVFC